MRLVTCLLCSATLFAAMPVSAQETGNAESANIVVTALRRETVIQQTPVAITAISGTELERAGINDLTSLSSAPGLTFVDGGPSNTRIVIRGIQAVGEPTVGLYYDEVPVTGIVGPSNDAAGSAPRIKLFDVERVEVLRGPQGTLFGSGTMGGAVRILFRKPTGRFEGQITGEAGWTEHGGLNHSVNAMINAPITPDLLAIRLVAYDEFHNGYIDNVPLGIDGINHQHAYGGRALIRLTPTPQFTLDASVHYQHSSGDRPIWNLEAGNYASLARSRLPSPEQFAIYSLTGTWQGNGFEATATGSISHRTYEQAISDPSAYFEALIGNPAACARFRGSGGVCTPTMQADFDAYVSGFIHGIIIGFQKSTTHQGELRVSSTGLGPLQWTIGAFASDRTAHDDNNQVKTDPVSGQVIVPYVRQTERLIDDQLTQYAGFAEAALTPIDWLTVTGGLRYFHYRRETAGNVVIPLDLIGAVASSYTSFTASDDGVVFKGNLAVHPTQDLLIYVQAAQGFRPGGANQALGLPPELDSYNSDGLWTYEAGIKSSWQDKRITLDLAIYRTDWSDMQVTGTKAGLPFQFISNAGAARIQGIEAEFDVRPLPGLTLGATASYTHAVLTQDQKNENITANGLKGNRVPYVPEFTAGGMVSYAWPLDRHMQANIRLDGSYVGPSGSEFNPANVYYRRLEGYALFNLRAGIDTEDGWSAEVFVDNLFDEVGISWVQTNVVTAGRTLVTGTRPRTAGLSFGKRF